MYTTNLRKSGNLIVLDISQAMLESAGLSIGSEVSISTDGNCLIVANSSRQCYKLQELLAQCDESADYSQEEREWLDSPAIGRELL